MTVVDYLLIGVAIAIFTVAILKRAAIASACLGLQKFGQETKVEMQKVAWPSRNDTIGSTVVVLITIAVLTLYVTAADELLTLVLDFVLKSKGA